MRAIVIDRYGGPEVLTFRDVPPPTPGDDEVLVKVHAASVNPVDWQIREGLVKAFIRPPFPATLGCDLAGVVVQVGARATRFKVGDEVFAMMPHDWGAQAELVALPESVVALKPSGLSMVEAGAVGAVAVTAVHALRDIARVGPGASVLVNGASGGVGMAAVQVARALGAEVTAVCSAASFELVRGLGADRLIDYKTTDFTRGEPAYDVVFDCIGNRHYPACAPVMRGRWVHVTTMPTPRVFLRWMANPLFTGRVAPVIAKATPDRIEYIRALLADGRMKVVVDRVLRPEAIAEAQAYSKSGRAKGKIVLSFAPA